MADLAPEPAREEPPKAGGPIFARFGELGATAQAAVPGVYAFFVTVAPAAFGHGAGALAKPFAVLAILVLLGAAVAERRYPREARLVSVWGFTLTSALAWVFAGAPLAPTRLDALRGVTGMIAWGLFAYASAAPAYTKPKAAAPREGAPLVPRAKLARGDGLYLAFGAFLALAIQLVGWRTASQERALLVRLVLLVSGIGLLGAVMSAALARHARASAAPAKRRLRPTATWTVAVLLTWIAGGIAWLLLGRGG